MSAHKDPMLSAISDFAHEIEARNYYTNSYIDAVVEYCEFFGLEPSAVAPLIKKNPDLRAKIQAEAEDLHFIKPVGRKLPL